MEHPSASLSHLLEVQQNEGRMTAEEMDLRRKENIAYEYLCHLEEAKVWVIILTCFTLQIALYIYVCYSMYYALSFWCNEYRWKEKILIDAYEYWIGNYKGLYTTK